MTINKYRLHSLSLREVHCYNRAIVKDSVFEKGFVVLYYVQQQHEQAVGNTIICFLLWSILRVSVSYSVPSDLHRRAAY